MPDGTSVEWQGEAGVFGKLASMAGGMLEPLGRKNIQKLIDGLQKALSPTSRPDNCREPSAGRDASATAEAGMPAA